MIWTQLLAALLLALAGGALIGGLIASFFAPVKRPSGSTKGDDTPTKAGGGGGSARPAKPVPDVENDLQPVTDEEVVEGIEVPDSDRVREPAYARWSIVGALAALGMLLTPRRKRRTEAKHREMAG